MLLLLLFVSILCQEDRGVTPMMNSEKKKKNGTLLFLIIIYYNQYIIGSYYELLNVVSMDVLFTDWSLCL